MDNELLTPTTPAATAGWLLLYTVATFAGIFLGQRLFLRQRRQHRPLARWGAAIVLALSVAWLLLTVLALVYPHENHDTEWIAGRPELNYPIDIALGVVIALGAGLVWWRAVRGAGASSPVETKDDKDFKDSKDPSPWSP